MNIVIIAIGILIMLMGILYIIKPGILKKLMEFFKKGNRIYFAGLLRFVLAIIFLLGARESDTPIVITAFGIIFIISGLLVFMMGAKRTSNMLEWYLKQPASVLRLVASIALISGAVIVYFA